MPLLPPCDFCGDPAPFRLPGGATSHPACPRHLVALLDRYAGAVADAVLYPEVELRVIVTPRNARMPDAGPETVRLPPITETVRRRPPPPNVRELRGSELLRALADELDAEGIDPTDIGGDL